MKRIVILRVLITAIIGIVGYLLFWPVPIDPVAWNPPAPDTSGVYAENNELARIERLSVNSFAPEDVAIDSQGRIYTASSTDIFIACRLTARDRKYFHRRMGAHLG
jgi:hypothetical protein